MKLVGLGISYRRYIPDHQANPMDSDDKTYTETDLQQLEKQIDALIETVSLLKQENSSLRHQQDQLLSEKAQLVEKTELARNRVEAMITRLRSLELSS